MMKSYRFRFVSIQLLCIVLTFFFAVHIFTGRVMADPFLGFSVWTDEDGYVDVTECGIEVSVQKSIAISVMVYHPDDAYERTIYVSKYSDNIQYDYFEEGSVRSLILTGLEEGTGQIEMTMIYRDENGEERSDLKSLSVMIQSETDSDESDPGAETGEAEDQTGISEEIPSSDAEDIETDSREESPLPDAENDTGDSNSMMVEVDPHSEEDPKEEAIAKTDTAVNRESETGDREESKAEAKETEKKDQQKKAEAEKGEESVLGNELKETDGNAYILVSRKEIPAENDLGAEAETGTGSYDTCIAMGFLFCFFAGGWRMLRGYKRETEKVYPDEEGNL